MPDAIYPSLRDKVVLVTGGASGIGENIVRAFVEQGSRVGFLDFNREAGEALAGSLGAAVKYEYVDLRDLDSLPKAIDSIRAAFGPIDVLVNNAARDDRHTIDQVTPQYWRERMAGNLNHQFFATQAVYKDMEAKGGGSIINMSSSSYLSSSESFLVYKTAKSAVVGLTRALARELGDRNVRVNCILPGWVMTQRQLDLWVKPGSKEATIARQCVKRLLEARDISNMVLFLASDAAGGISAQSYLVDGGQY